MSEPLSRGCNGTEGVVADPEYGTLVEYSEGCEEVDKSVIM